MVLVVSTLECIQEELTVGIRKVLRRLYKPTVLPLDLQHLCMLRELIACAVVKNNNNNKIQCL